MTIRSKARYFIAGLLAAFVGLPIAIFATDTVPLTFQSGDVISASVMNQLFARVNAATQLPTPQSLVGTWSCTEVLGGPLYLNTPSTYSTDPSGLFSTRQNTLSISAGPTSNAVL